MPQIIEVPGMGQVEFPDGMTDDQIATAIKANMPGAASEAKPEGSNIGNLAAGLVRGAGSIGATILAPVDMISDAIDGKGFSLESNRERRAGIDGGLQALGAQPDSLLYKGGKLAGEIAGTAGVGGVAANGIRALSNAPAATALANAVASGGMSTGPGLGTMANLATRAAGGAITGGVSAGLVDPSAAGTGAAIGAALPVAARGVAAGVGALGARAGRASVAAPVVQDAQKMATARAGAEAGFVIPPADLQPGMVSQLLSGLSGKIKTSQVASQRNQLITDDLARRALGLEAGAELTPEVLQAVRSRAGDAYSTIRGAGAVQADQAFLDRLTQIGAVSQGASRSFPGLKQNGIEEMIAAVRQPSFDAGDAVDAIKVLREAADKGFRTGDATAGRAAKAAASALEDQLERHLSGAGNAEAVKAFRDARAQIAKTYSVQGALNPATGSVSAPKLAGDLLKGKPLSGELRQVAEFSQAFPKATQALKEAPGAVSPLDWLFSGGTALGVGGPAGAAMLLGRPAARAALLSGPVQARALQERAASEPLRSLLARALEAGVPAAPVLLSGLGGSP